jgi:hypothetical protein
VPVEDWRRYGRLHIKIEVGFSIANYVELSEV